MKFTFPFTSLRTGLMLTYLFLIASSLGLLAWRIGSSLDASRFSETQRDQEGRAILAASIAGDWLANYQSQAIDASVLRHHAETLAREISQSVALLDVSGKVLVDTEHPNEIDHDDSKEPEIVAAMTGRVANAVRYDVDDRSDALFTVAPARHDGVVAGYVRLELPMWLVEETRRQFWLRIVGATILAGFITVIVSLGFARALTNPLARINRAATALANGDLKQRIQITGPQELEQLAHGFNFMAERIEQVMEDQRAFVANAAHELRTPLTTIRLRAEALSEGAKDDPSVAPQFLDDIVAETDRLSRLVGQLLDLSRIETGVMALHREPVALDTLAQTLVNELASRAAQKNIELQIDAPNHLPRVNADPDQMRQVWLNLIVNAIKFTPVGGRITIEVRRVTLPRPSKYLPAGDWVTGAIADTGVGIDAADLPHIFERFYRVDKSRTRSEVDEQSEGVGLGLAIVKSIIDAHRGRIWVESQPGVGTVFTFALPI